MKKHDKFFKPLLHMMFPKNPGTWMMLLSIALYILIPSVIANTSSSMLVTIKQANSEVYGNFTNIYYDAEPKIENQDLFMSSTDVDKLLNGTLIDSFGVMYLSGQAAAGDDILNIGYADENSIDLGYLELKEGKWPQTDNETALTEEALEKVAEGKTVGDTFTFMNREYHITGIVNNYGKLWPKGQEQINNKIAPPDMFITKGECESTFLESGYITRIILISRNIMISDNITDSATGKYFSNLNTLSEDDAWRYRTPAEFIFISCGICLFLLVVVMIFSAPQLKERYKKLKQLGISNGRARKILNAELAVLLICAVLIGAALLLAGTLLCVNILSWNLGRTIIYSLNYEVIIFAVVTAIIFTFTLGNMIFTDFGHKEKGLKAKNKPAKSSLLRMTWLEFKGAPISVLIMILTAAISIFFVFYIDSYNSQYKDDSAYVETEGRMPVDYDVEIYLSDDSPGSMEEGDLTIISSFEKDGLSQAALNQIESLEGVESVNGYRESAKVHLVIPSGMFDPYLDISDGILDGKYVSSDMANNAMLTRYMNYGDASVTRVKFVGYSEEEILSFNSHISEGSINIDKLNSGEEIILIVPALRYEESIDSDGARRYEFVRVNADDETAINDTLFHVGDEILLSEIHMNSYVNGGVTKEEFESIAYRNDRKVKIGAIVRTCIGWFDAEYFASWTYRVMTTNAAFEAMGIDSTYLTVHVREESNADPAYISNEIRNIIAEFPKMKVNDESENNKNYRELKALINLMCGVLTVLAIATALAVIVFTMISKAKNNARFYELYRTCGAHKTDVIAMNAVQLIVTLAAAVLIALLSCLILGL